MITDSRYKHTRLDRHLLKDGIYYSYCGYLHSSDGPAFMEYDGQIEFCNSTIKPFGCYKRYFNWGSYNTMHYDCNETGILHIDKDEDD